MRKTRVKMLKEEMRSSRYFEILGEENIELFEKQFRQLKKWWRKLSRPEKARLANSEDNVYESFVSAIGL